MYLALERCVRTLHDAVMVPPTPHAHPEDSDQEEQLAEADLWRIARDTVEGVHVRLLPVDRSPSKSSHHMHDSLQKGHQDPT